jgi:hypothetical protein
MQQPPQFVLKRKTRDTVRVDTLKLR